MVQSCSLCSRDFANHAAWTNHRQRDHPDVGTSISDTVHDNDNAVSQTFDVHEFDPSDFMHEPGSNDEEFVADDFVFAWEVDSDEEQSDLSDTDDEDHNEDSYLVVYYEYSYCRNVGGGRVLGFEEHIHNLSEIHFPTEKGLELANWFQRNLVSP